MRRLYLQVYLAFVAILVVSALAAGAAWWYWHDDTDERRLVSGLAAMFEAVLPDGDRPAAELQASLAQWSARLGLDLALAAADGTVLAEVGGPLPVPRRGAPAVDWQRGPGHGAVVNMHLSDGRWLVVRHRHDRGPRWLLALLAAALAVAAGVYPLARRITRRLERLRGGVENLGGGDLAARVEVEGRDEVADLARSFNQAAARIERLVGAQRAMLASASHELRSPLARIRMSLELIGDGGRPDLRAGVERDVAELDDLIEELLLASRLDALDALPRGDAVDLLALAAEEGARAGAAVEGEAGTIAGDARSLRRMLRNLLENARRHGKGAPIRVRVSAGGDAAARIVVEDEGPGVPPGEHERIFEPFYRPPGMVEGKDRGVGLGLALVRRIARHHGGDARCLPREGGGTRFEVTLARR